MNRIDALTSQTLDYIADRDLGDENDLPLCLMSGQSGEEERTRGAAPIAVPTREHLEASSTSPVRLCYRCKAAPSKFNGLCSPCEGGPFVSDRHEVSEK